MSEDPPAEVVELEGLPGLELGGGAPSPGAMVPLPGKAPAKPPSVKAHLLRRLKGGKAKEVAEVLLKIALGEPVGEDPGVMLKAIQVLMAYTDGPASAQRGVQEQVQTKLLVRAVERLEDLQARQERKRLSKPRVVKAREVEGAVVARSPLPFEPPRRRDLGAEGGESDEGGEGSAGSDG